MGDQQLTIEVFAVGITPAGVYHIDLPGAERGAPLRWSVEVSAGHPMRLAEHRLHELLPDDAAPRCLHGTSWRWADGDLILSFIAVLPPLALAPLTAPLHPAPLARGTATAPPAQIEVAAVRSHAIRHLALLVQTDVAAQAAVDFPESLAGWVPDLAGALHDRMAA